MKYSIVIPTYNHCDDLLKPCVESIFKYTNVSDIELIISANGCKDNTFEYLGALKEKYNYLGLGDNLKLLWDFNPLGYAKATNEGIKVATTDLIVLLNNDILLLEQSRNQWLDILAAQFNNPKCGISCLIKGFSEPAGQDFAIFFCVMIHRKVFDKIGLLPLDYGVGGGEDTEFSIECERAGFEVNEAVNKAWSPDANLYTGNFPIYHKGEGTVHDVNLVPEWNRIFDENSLTLAKKYNPKWYQWKISNDSERGVFFKGDPVNPRETGRYVFAANNLAGPKILEIGCSSGYGLQFFPDAIDYTGIDYDSAVIESAKNQNWKPNAKFFAADINKWLEENPNEVFDNIIAYESIEHISNGLEVLEKVKNRTKRIFVTVPYNENPGQFSRHHVLHNLKPDNFKQFTCLGIVDIDGNVISLDKAQANIEYSLLLVWDVELTSLKPEPQPSSRTTPGEDLKWLAEQHEEIYKEVIVDNCYNVSANDFVNEGTVIDIGANIGVFSLLAAYLGAKKVIAVEPVQTTFSMLNENKNRAGFTNIVTLKNLVSDVKGREFKISLNENSGHNSMYNVAENYEMVRTVTLTDLLSQVDGDNVFLKIDCEGAEYDIILNASQKEMDRVKRIVVEIHAELHPIYKGFDLINDKLASFGFKRDDVKQIYFWYVGPDGQPYDMKPLPYRIELWSR